MALSVLAKRLKAGLKVAIPVIGWCVFAPAISQETSLDDLLNLSLEELSQYPVTAPTRSAVPVGLTPGAVSLITYEQIRRSGAQTIPDLLRSVPGINVRWNPMVQSISIRGFGSNPFTSQVLLLIDGVPYNSWNKGGFPQHPGFDFFNLQNVKHLEIIRGPGSALYGENALNGVINIVTLSGEEVNHARANLAAGARDTRSASLSYGGGLGDDGSIFVSARRLESTLPTDLWRDTEGARSTDFFVKAKYGKFQFSAYRLSDEYDGYVENLDNGGRFRSAESIEQSVNIVALSYQHRSDSGRFAASAVLSYSNRDGSHCAACHANGTNDRFSRSTDHGSQLFGNTQLNFKINESHQLTVGAEFRKLDSGNHSEELAGSDLVSGNSHAHGGHQSGSVLQYDKTAVFAQHEVELLNERLNLSAGVRYDGETDPDLFKGRLFPRASAVFQATDRVTLRAGWNRAARYPSFSELYQASPFLNLELGDQVIPVAIFEANGQLAPETIESVEVGVGFRLTENLNVRADLFRNRINDHIHLAYPRFRWENHPGEAVTAGAEVDVRYFRGTRWELFGNWSYQDNRQSGPGVNSAGDGLDFSYAPRNKINLGAVFKPSRFASVLLDVRWKSSYTAPAFWFPFAYPDNPEPAPLPSYALVDLRLNWKLPFGAVGGKRPIEMFATGRNLLDETPFETLTGFGGQLNGREWHLGFEYRFSL